MGWRPQPVDVMQSLLMISIHGAESYTEFCRDTCLDDSELTLQSWQASRKARGACKRIFGRELETAQELANNF